MGRYTLDTATDYLLGASVDSLDNGDNQFATHFNEVQRIIDTNAVTNDIAKDQYSDLFFLADRFMRAWNTSTAMSTSS